MKKAIAMKCNQEQWDAIKSKLVGCNILDIETFDNKKDYLINNYIREQNSITNFSKSSIKGFNIEFHEIWNEQVFLEACGIETEKIFKAGELEYIDLNGEWTDTIGKYRVKIKPDNSAKIAELKEQIKKLENE